MKTLFSAGTGGMPLVSVLISLYNYSQYIEEALDSVASQTLEDIELIIAMTARLMAGKKSPKTGSGRMNNASAARY